MTGNSAHDNQCTSITWVLVHLLANPFHVTFIISFSCAVVLRLQDTHGIAFVEYFDPIVLFHLVLYRAVQVWKPMPPSFKRLASKDPLWLYHQVVWLYSFVYEQSRFLSMQRY